MAVSLIAAYGVTAAMLAVGVAASWATRRPHQLATMMTFWPAPLVSELPMLALMLVMLSLGSLAYWRHNYAWAIGGLTAVYATPSLLWHLRQQYAARQLCRQRMEEAGVSVLQVARPLSWKKSLMGVAPVSSLLARNLVSRHAITFATARKHARRDGAASAGAPAIDGVAMTAAFEENLHAKILRVPDLMPDGSSVNRHASPSAKGMSVVLEQGHCPLTLDLFWHSRRYGRVLQPRGSAEPPRPAPILLNVHGGGWVLGHSSYSSLPLLYEFARAGWLVATVNYRLAPHATFPAMLCDVKAAVFWLRLHAAELRADPGCIAVAGDSAGGHLALLVGFTGNVPRYQPRLRAGALTASGTGGTSRSAPDEVNPPLPVDTSVAGVISLYGVTDWTDADGQYHAKAKRSALPGHRSIRDFVARVVLQRPFAPHADVVGDADNTTQRGAVSAAEGAAAWYAHLHEFILGSPRWWVHGASLPAALLSSRLITLPAPVPSPAPPKRVADPLLRRRAVPNSNGESGSPEDDESAAQPPPTPAAPNAHTVSPRWCPDTGVRPAPSEHVLPLLDDMLQDRVVPPICLVHGVNDNLVPVEDSQLLWAALRQRRQRDMSASDVQATANVRRAAPAPASAHPDVYLELPGAHHSFNLLLSPRSFAVADALVDWANELWQRHERSSFPASRT
jgi:acetyl esterase/lipase